MRKPENTSIMIDLEKSQSAASFSDENLFFSEHLAKAIDIITAHVDELSEPVLAERGRIPESESKYLHKHDSISVFGSRGVGKTSFILTLMNRLRNPSGSLTEQKKSSIKKIQVLDTIDPSLTEENEVFLATIVSNIIRVVEDNQHDADPRALRAFNEALRDLAQGFRLLYNTDKTALYQQSYGDPDLFAEQVLRDAEGGMRLSASFHNFVVAAAKAINKHAFVQPLDDVDTAYNRGWKVLETLRKYLASQRFITILSGDLDLYKLIVRAEQWKNLRILAESEGGIGLDDLTGRNPTRYIREVDQLQEQYIHKLLPVRRRLHLRSIASSVHEHAISGDERITLSWSNTNDIKLSSLYQDFCRHNFAWPYPKTSDNFDILNPRRWKPSKLFPNNSRKFIRFLDEVKNWNGIKALTSTETSLSGLASVFEHALYNRSISEQDLDLILRGDGIDVLMRFTLRYSEQLQNIWSLSPDYESIGTDKDGTDWNHAVLIIQAHVNRAWQSKFHQPISYMIKVVGLSLLMNQVFLDPDAPTTIGQNQKFDKFDTRLSLNKSEDSTVKAARGLSLYLEGSRKGARLPETQPGLMRLKQRPNKKKIMLSCLLGLNQFSELQDIHHGYKAWWLVLKGYITLNEDDNNENNDNIFISTLSSDEKISLFLPSTSQWRNRVDELTTNLLDWFTVKYDSLSAGADYLSIEIGIASIYDFLDEYLDRNSDPNIAAKVFQEIVSRNISQSFSIEKFGKEDDDIDVIDTNLEAPTSKDDSSRNFQKLFNTLSIWVTEFQKLNALYCEHGVQLAPPTQVIGTAFETFRKNLNSLNDSGKFELVRYSVGTMLETWCISFFHALILSESAHRGFPESKLDRRSVLKTFSSFERNLQSLCEPDVVAWRVVPYSMALMSCPIFQGILSNETRSNIAKLFELNEPNSPILSLSVDTLYNTNNFEYKDFVNKYFSKFQDLVTHGSNLDPWQHGFWIQDDVSVECSSHSLLCALPLIPTASSPKASRQDLQKAATLIGIDWNEIASDKDYEV